ncbi:hypothetical protein C2G38_2128859, partial [Gigaspora rosea]
MHYVLLLLLLTAVMPYLLSLFCLYLYFTGCARPCYVLYFWKCSVSFPFLAQFLV